MSRNLKLPTGLAALAAMFYACGLSADDKTTKIDAAAYYKDTCAACHGEKGEGTDVFKSPLAGDLSLKQLTEYIDKTMPEGSPEDCVGEEAEAVARYIYDAFYSPIAQARNRPARVELSRLTVRQHQNALADLLGSFGQQATVKSERGLKAEYYSSRNFRKNNIAIERIDPVIDFDFGESSPDPEKIKPEEFGIRWHGSILAPVTGEYQIILHSSNAVRLWLNNSETPLIDARVRSGDRTEYTATIHLLAGRPHYLRLELFKQKDKKSSARLEWVPPGGVQSVIPNHCLTPHWAPELFVLTTPFPPDDRSLGYARGTAVSEEWDRATTYAALETAGFVVDRLKRFAGGPQPERLRKFSERFAELAFRRPLTKDEKELFIDKQFKAAEHPIDAVKRVILLSLKSPRFLYLETGLGPLDDYAVASWLSFGLWDSIPDKMLLEEAKQGRLKTREQIVQQAQRMVNDHRAQAKLHDFLHLWLNMDRLHELSKDPERFPGFDEKIVADLRTSLDLFLEEVLSSDSCDFRQLLLADRVYLNDRLAKFYEVDSAEVGPQFKPIEWQPEVRAGVLSHPYLLAGFSYREASSPIHRGVFLTRNVLGRMLKPPPIAVAPLPVDLHPNLTTRQRVTLQTDSAECMRCHETINHLGFALENFDAVGRFRTKEGESPVDSSGHYTTREGNEVRFEGAEQLAQYLAGSPEVHAAFAERLFQNALKQPVRAFGDDFHQHLCDNFTKQGFNIRKLAADAVAESILRARENPGRLASLTPTKPTGVE